MLPEFLLVQGEITSEELEKTLACGSGRGRWGLSQEQNCPFKGDCSIERVTQTVELRGVFSCSRLSTLLGRGVVLDTLFCISPTVNPTLQEGEGDGPQLSYQGARARTPHSGSGSISSRDCLSSEISENTVLGDSAVGLAFLAVNRGDKLEEKQR